MAKKDFYEVLGVNKSASADELKKAYRKLAMEHHPDKAQDAEAKKTHEAKFKEINEAYDVLKDPQKKAAYDSYGHAAFEQGGFGNAGRSSSGGGGGQAGGNPFGGGGFDFNFQSGGGNFSGEDIFDMFFGGGNRSRRSAQRSNAGRDLHYSLAISFDKAVHGGEEQVQIRHQAECHTCHGSGAAKDAKTVTCDRCGGSGEIHQTSQSIFGQFTQATVCPKCHGEGKVVSEPCPTCGGKGRQEESEELTFNVPAGVDTGTEMRFAGKGDAGIKGGRAGDLYLEFKVQPHKYFQRRGNNIHLEVPLNLSQASLGTNLKVPTIDGDITVKIPSGTKHGTEIRLSGKGVKKLEGSGRGDQLLSISIAVPSKPSGEEKKILEQLSRVEPEPKKPWS